MVVHSKNRGDHFGSNPAKPMTFFGKKISPELKKSFGAKIWSNPAKKKSPFGAKSGQIQKKNKNLFGEKSDQIRKK